MTSPYQLSLHVFRRDLRLEDNTALIAALKSSARVLPCFIFDKRQIELNDYKSDHALQFMAHSLRELSQALEKKQGRLFFFYGIAEEVIAKLITLLPIDAIFINRDYTPFSRKRDEQIQKICQKQKIDFNCYADALLHEPEEIHKDNKEPYLIFTPFFRKASQRVVNPSQKNTNENYYIGNIELEDIRTLPKLLQKSNPNLSVKGGRREAVSLLKEIRKLEDYETVRNFPALPGTSHLSAHLKFGTLSPREFYHQVIKIHGPEHKLITELYWRDFFTHIAFHFPYVFQGCFHSAYDAMPWRKDQIIFRAWCEGRTGFPIVDAGMRELNTTGYMHNRVRMIVGSFLTKDLHIDWHWGEKYFAQKLVDYDPSVNNGNWQWVASTGCDAQPYFRIFNPWSQQQIYDPDCVYIKRWIPELSLLPNETIHRLNRLPAPPLTNYPSPIIDHSAESKKTKLMYKKLL